MTRAPLLTLLAVGMAASMTVAFDSAPVAPAASHAAPAPAGADVVDAAPRASAFSEAVRADAAGAPHAVEVVAAATAALAGAGGLLVDEAGATCAPGDVRVRWSLPSGEHRSGAHIEPLGPAPGPGDTAVNGVLVCAGVDGVYVGFEAFRVGAAWAVALVPDPEPFGHDDEAGHSAHNHADDGPVASATGTPVAAAASSLGGSASGAAIEGYAAYEPQLTCDPTAKAGALALRDLLLSRHPGTSSMGITRDCSIGGRSEHKEGRAFDWGVSVHDASDRAAADDFLARLLATDADGNRHALARRMGVMYVIWNHQIWSSSRPDAGWRSYSGASPHTDHVHISLSWAGGLGQTSFWSGAVADGLVTPPAGTTPTTNGPAPGGGGHHHPHDHGGDEEPSGQTEPSREEKGGDAGGDAPRGEGGGEKQRDDTGREDDDPADGGPPEERGPKPDKEGRAKDDGAGPGRSEERGGGKGKP